MRFLLLITGLLLTTSAMAITPRTKLLNAASAEVHDYHCVCKKLSNATGKDVLVPWRTLAEWTSYYNAAVPSLTAAACTGVVPGDPPVAIPNYSDIGNACNITTGTFSVTNVQNSGGYNLRIIMPAGYFTAVAGGCVATLWKTNGDTLTSVPLISGLNTVNFCNNSEFHIYFSCATDGNHSHTVTVENEGGSAELDDFGINFIQQSGCVF